MQLTLRGKGDLGTPLQSWKARPAGITQQRWEAEDGVQRRPQQHPGFQGEEQD